MKATLLKKHQQLKECLKNLKNNANLPEHFSEAIKKLEKELNQIEQQINSEVDLPTPVFEEANIDTLHWYTDEDINAVVRSRIGGLGRFEAGKRFLLQGIGQQGDYPEDKEDYRYKVLLTDAVDTQQKTIPLTFFFDHQQQAMPHLRDDRQDIFAELLPLLAQENLHLKILFPYNDTQRHWTLAEIKMAKTDHRYAINFFVHDPYGSGQMGIENYDELCRCFQKKIIAYDRLATFEFNNHQSPYQKPRQASGDGVSCGVMVAEELLQRVAGASLDRDQPYASGAESLRKKHLDDLKIFYQNEPGNQTLKNFIARNVKATFRMEEKTNPNLDKLQQQLERLENMLADINAEITKSQQPKQSQTTPENQHHSNNSVGINPKLDRQVVLVLQRKHVLQEKLIQLQTIIGKKIINIHLKAALDAKINAQLDSLAKIKSGRFY